MTSAPSALASWAYCSCLSSIASLVPGQSVCTKRGPDGSCVAHAADRNVTPSGAHNKWVVTVQSVHTTETDRVWPASRQRSGTCEKLGSVRRSKSTEEAKQRASTRSYSDVGGSPYSSQYASTRDPATSSDRTLSSARRSTVPSSSATWSTVGIETRRESRRRVVVSPLIRTRGFDLAHEATPRRRVRPDRLVPRPSSPDRPRTPSPGPHTRLPLAASGRSRRAGCECTCTLPCPAATQCTAITTTSKPLPFTQTVGASMRESVVVLDRPHKDAIVTAQ